MRMVSGIVPTGGADTRRKRGALIGPHADDNVWAELQHLGLQMDLLLKNARHSQVTFQAVGPSHGPVQVSGDELGRQAHDHRVMSELASGPASAGYTESQFPLRYSSGMPCNGHQYVASWASGC